jgi:hypothetical protein
MRKVLIGLLLLGLAGPSLQAEVSLSGEAAIGLSAFPVLEYDGDRFSSPLNPENILGLHDLNMATDLRLKLSGRETTGAFAFWAAVKPYELAQAVLASADTPEQVAAVADALNLAGTAPSGLEILRAYAQWYPTQALMLTIGRQALSTGYGYGWNPMDFFSARKDPSDPEQELEGVDALSVQYSVGNLLILKLAGILRPQPFASGVDFGALQGAVEATLSLPSFELKLSGLYKHGTADSGDPYVPAAGVGFMADLAGLGLYGEAALLAGSRVPLADTGSLHWQGGCFFDGLLGLQYTFASELSLTAEYLYNGEGYSLAQRRSYQEALEAFNATDGIAPAEYLMIYRPGQFARQYALLDVQIPAHAISATIDLCAIYSPDSWALQLLPDLTVDLSGSLSATLSYTGMFGLKAGEFNETSLTPVRHTLQLSARYIF